MGKTTSDYYSLVKTVLDENRQVLERVDVGEVSRLVDEIGSAASIQLFAMGRMRSSMVGFAMRLMHMGFDAHVVYAPTTPRIKPGDLLIVNCGVTAVSLNVIKCAKDAGAKVCVLTAHPENEHGELADFTVYVPGQIFGDGNEVASVQPMASLLEQSLFLLEDVIAMMVMDRYEIDAHEMEERHTNLEGIDRDFA